MPMDISTTGKSGYKIKSKNSSVLFENGQIVLDGQPPFKISEPGEYEVGGVSVIGVQDPEGKIFVVELDGMRTAFLDKVTHKLTELQVEEIGPVDIAVLPNLVAEVATQVDSWVILCETGAETPAVPKYSVTADKLPTETTTVVLERKG
jgi:hypothetical protein